MVISIHFTDHAQQDPNITNEYPADSISIQYSVDVHAKKARKLLRELQESASNNDCTNKNSDSLANMQSDDASSETDDLPLAVPGFILLSVGFLFPCFRPRRKEISPPSVRPNQLLNSGEYIGMS